MKPEPYNGNQMQQPNPQLQQKAQVMDPGMLQGMGNIQQILQQNMQQRMQQQGMQNPMMGQNPMQRNPMERQLPDIAGLKQALAARQQQLGQNPMDGMQKDNFYNPALQANAAAMQSRMQQTPPMTGQLPNGKPFPGRIPGNAAPRGTMPVGMPSGSAGGGMNPYAQKLQQTGANPANMNSVTAKIRPTAMSDMSAKPPALKFSNPDLGKRMAATGPQQNRASWLQSAQKKFGKPQV